MVWEANQKLIWIQGNFFQCFQGVLVEDHPCLTETGLEFTSQVTDMSPC